MANIIVKQASDASVWRSIRPLLWIGGILLITLTTYLYVRGLLTGLRIIFADDQTAVFEEMRQKAEEAVDVKDAVGCLEHAVRYYPSGTKQVEGSPLDRIVERARQIAVHDMIAILRKRTDQDFGDDPQRWIDGIKGASEAVSLSPERPVAR